MVFSLSFDFFSSDLTKYKQSKNRGRLNERERKRMELQTDILRILNLTLIAFKFQCV